MEEFRRMIIKVADTTGVVATVPTTNDHTDGSWLSTDIYKGEFFLNTADDILQTRTESGIITVTSGGAGVTNFLGLTDVPSSYIGHGEYFVKVKQDLSGLEFVAREDQTIVTPLTIGTSRSLISTDKNKDLQNDNNITLTVPTNATVYFEVGTVIFLTKKFESFVIAPDTGVTINSVDGLLELGRINSGAYLHYLGSDEWDLKGELI